MITEQMLMASSLNSGDPFNAVKFDGANDYLIRGADLTGIADSKSGIFSGWVRLDNQKANQILLANLASGDKFRIGVNSASGVSASYFYMIGRNAAGAAVLTALSSGYKIAAAKWYHILSSWDLASSTGSVYINDVADMQGGATFTNDTIDYVTATPNWAVGNTTDGVNPFGSSMAELYFAPGQYLDFSVTANRRKFIDASGLPVGLGADGSTPTGTAPIVYLRGDKTNFGTNSGTGGNFTVNGALETASTTPATLPSFNAVKFDGTNDYLTRGADLTGIADGKSGILSAWLRIDTLGTSYVLCNLSTTIRFWLATVVGNLIVRGFNSSGTQILNIPNATTLQASPRFIHLMASWDLAAAATHLYILGVSDKGAVTATNDTIDYSTASANWAVASDTAGGSKWNGAISELYFAPNQYLDLSVQENREKFILNGAPVALGADGSLPTGTAPAIYLPNRAALVGTNAGTGGNFTVNGAPKDANSTPVYYYAEPAKFDGSTTYVTRGGDLTGIADGKAGTISFWLRKDGGDGAYAAVLENVMGSRFYVGVDFANKIFVQGQNAAGPVILTLTSNSTKTASPLWLHFIASWDLAIGSGYLYINNVSDLAAGATLTNDTIDYVTATPNWAIGANTDGTNKINAAISDLWFTTTYLDISQASNRAKFIDQTTLRPIALGAKGELPTGTQPLLYLGRDYANFQTNLGSGGAFTVAGALTRGTTSPSDVKA